MKAITRYLATALTVAALTFGAAAPAAATGDGGAGEAPSVEDTGCGDLGHWPAAVQGRPEGLQAGSAAGLYVWHDLAGWHVVATHPGHDMVTFKGRVLSSGKIFGVGRAVEGRDVVNVALGHSRLDFRFVNWGYLDGVQFGTRCAERIVITGTVNGVRLTPDQVFIGRDGHHPDSVPFDIVRVAGT